VARSLFKLASGVKTPIFNIEASDLLNQMGDMREEMNKENDAQSKGEWFSTHPFSPLRLNAAKLFSGSEFFLRSIGATKNGVTDEQLEEEVSDLMSLMEPTYLQEKSEVAESMRRLLLAGAAAIASANGTMNEVEKKRLEDWFGASSISGLNMAALAADLVHRARDVKEKVPKLKRHQVLRDLCVMALADTHSDEAERKILHDIASQCDVSPTLIDRTLASGAVLD
jgi:tellurite resistance protein